MQRYRSAFCYPYTRTGLPGGSFQTGGSRHGANVYYIVAPGQQQAIHNAGKGVNRTSPVTRRSRITDRIRARKSRCRSLSAAVRRLRLALSAGLCFAAASAAVPAAAQTTPRATEPIAPGRVGGGRQAGPANSLVFLGSAGELEVRAPRLEDPEIRINGMLDEDAWAGAAVLAGFTQFNPVEGEPAEEPTEVLILYTSDAIYFGIQAFDSRPDLIPAILAPRDRGIFGDDWVRLMIDTFNDERQAYLFYVNPLGLQADGLWIEGLRREGDRPPVDLNPDFIWESFGRVTDNGWVAEIKIPYVSLQFPQAEVQTWGFNVAREVRRTGYEQSWAPLTQNITSALAQGGQLMDLQGLTAKRLVELIPVATGQVNGAYDDDNDRFVREGLEPQFGIDGRFAVTRNMMLGATINPDFSQVEADADVITVNERFAIFLPEQRPFFLDGTEVFQTPAPLVYTRRIVDPLGGVKLAGKAGPLYLGYLGSLDQSPVAFETATDRALFNLGRARMDVGTNSNVGALYTDRTIVDGSEYNRVGALDTRLLFGPRYSLTLQVGGAWTREMVDADEDSGEGSDVTSIAQTRFGPLFYADFQRSGREFGWQLLFQDVHPDFETQSGFIRRVGDIRTFATAQRTFFRPPGSGLQAYGFELRLDGYFDHTDFWSGEERRPFEFEVEGQFNMSFRGNRMLNTIIRDGYFRFRQEDYADYQVRLPDGTLAPYQVPDPLTHMLAGGFFSWWRFSNEVSLRGMYFYRVIPIYAEGSRGRELLLSPSLELRPTPSMQVDLSYGFSRIWRTEDGSFYSAADTPRLRFQYQFTRALFTRLLFQYDLEKRDALRDPTTGYPIYIDREPVEANDSGDFLGQILIAFEPSPRTIVYVGWSRQMTGDRSFAISPKDLETEGFFAKLSYLIRL